MVKISVENFTDDELLKKYNELEQKEDFDERCKDCKMPQLLHKVACTRRDEVNAFEFERIANQWELFSTRMRNVIKWKNEQDDKEKFRKGMIDDQKEMMQQFMETQGLMVEALKGLGNRATTKIVKTTKVPTWT